MAHLLDVSAAAAALALKWHEIHSALAALQWEEYTPFAFGWALGTAVALLCIAAWLTSDMVAGEKRALERDLRHMRELAALYADSGAPLTALVTGANSGIGYTLALLLAGQGVRVVLGCRSAERGAAAVGRIRQSAPGSDVRLLILDVADPESAFTAGDRLSALLAPAAGTAAAPVHIDYLYLNAGVMPVSGFRWTVPLVAFLTGNLVYFLTTGRSSPRSSHFIAQPEDELGAAGAPSVFATHVLGHLALVRSLQPLMGPLPRAGSRLGRIVWTGSRSATAAKLRWEHLEPPPHGGEARDEAEAETAARSGHERWLATGERHAEAYGEAKYAMDLLNPALARRLPNPTSVICPGFVDTDMAPWFFKLVLPAMVSIRGALVGFNVDGVIGAHVLLAAALAEPSLLRPNAKYVTHCGELAVAEAGAPGTSYEDEERMYGLCDAWMRVWRRTIGHVNGSSDSAAPAPPTDQAEARRSAAVKVVPAGARRRAQSGALPAVAANRARSSRRR